MRLFVLLLALLATTFSVAADQSKTRLKLGSFDRPSDHPSLFNSGMKLSYSLKLDDRYGYVFPRQSFFSFSDPNPFNKWDDFGRRDVFFRFSKDPTASLFGARVNYQPSWGGRYEPRSVDISFFFIPLGRIRIGG